MAENSALGVISWNQQLLLDCSEIGRRTSIVLHPVEESPGDWMPIGVRSIFLHATSLGVEGCSGIDRIQVIEEPPGIRTLKSWINCSCRRQLVDVRSCLQIILLSSCRRTGRQSNPLVAGTGDVDWRQKVFESQTIVIPSGKHRYHVFFINDSHDPGQLM